MAAHHALWTAYFHGVLWCDLKSLAFFLCSNQAMAHPTAMSEAKRVIQSGPLKGRVQAKRRLLGGWLIALG